MKRIILTAIMAVLAGLVHAQTTNKAITENDPAVRAKDSTIKEDMIIPAQEAAGDDAPDWVALQQAVTRKYDATTADRVITKAKIYYYYSKDWPAFCACIVHYTNNYESADDYKLLNLNAGMLLKISTDQAELKEAARWAKAAADSDPANAAYKKTCEDLKAKITP